MEESGKFHAVAAQPEEKSLGGWVGPTFRVGLKKIEKYLVCAGIE
jgi:hypothetical protein